MAELASKIEARGIASENIATGGSIAKGNTKRSKTIIGCMGRREGVITSLPSVG
jgi:hypothetical protein